MSESRAVYIGVDNDAEVEVVFPKATRTKIRALAKDAGVTEAELLAEFLLGISLAGLAGTAHRMAVDAKVKAKESKPVMHEVISEFGSTKTRCGIKVTALKYNETTENWRKVTCSKCKALRKVALS